MGFSRPEFWSGLPCPPRELSNPGFEPRSHIFCTGREDKKKKKTESTICSLQEDQLRAKDTQTESRGMEKDISGKWK